MRNFNFSRMFLALALVMLGAVSVKAEERISLQEVPFYSWDGWDGNAAKIAEANCAWGVGTSTGSVYGDPSVINYADVTLYSKLILTVSEGTPRVLFNRLKDEGQGAATFEESYLVDIPNQAWCTSRYQTVDGTVYTYDIKAIVKDYGFAHLHAIKGANWANVTVESAELVREGKAQQVGWTEVTTNGNLEGEDVANYFTKEAPSAEILPAVITDSIGANGTRGIMVTSVAGAVNDWDSQFWIMASETLPVGTKYRVAFDYRANQDVAVATQAHAAPGSYIHWDMVGTVNFTSEWQRFTFEGEVTADQAGADNLLQSIAFNLSVNKEADVEFYFDNIRFEVYKYGVTAEFSGDVIQLDFGFETNLPSLVAACGKPRLLYPMSCASIKVNGTETPIYSIEGLADGRFYIFMQEGLNDDDVVEVVFANPADEAYHLVYNGGPGGDVKDFAGEATNNSSVYEAEDAYPYDYVTPIVVAADPEHGSFNLPNSISEFKVTFDKNVDCAALVATLSGEALTVSPADGFAEEVVLKRTSAGDLASGEYMINLTKIYPEMRLADDIFGDTTYVINVGKVNLDPSDTLRAVLPDYFSATAQGGIPEGWYMVYDGVQREPGTTHGSGANMKAFAAGGDFTRGFYTRTNNSTPDQCIVEYGLLDGYALTLEAGKKYKIHYNLISWKGTTFTRFEIYDPNDEIVYTRVDENKGTVNGTTGIVVTGSNSIDYTFYPQTTGNYRLRWTPTNAAGELVEGMTEIVFANPQVVYLPNAAGVEETQALVKSLNAAKDILAACTSSADDRYAGAALDAVAAAVAKYEAEYGNYTAPSAYTNAIAALDAAAQALSDHRGLCDAYYALPEQAQKIVDDNASKKFANTDLYATLKELAAKYVTKNVETQTNEETGEVVEVVTLIVKRITDDAELQAAIDELKVPVNTSAKLFTEGVSQVSTTGVAALVERLRLGAEALKSFGVAEDNELVVAAYNALTDDDDLAEKIKAALKLQLYGQLKNADNTLFEEKLDTVTLESYTDTYDMTVFVKNPNIYKQGEDLNYSTESVPGWIVPEGAANPGLSWGWSDPGYTVLDGMFQTWGASYGVEQTITDLPAGVYTIKVGFGERNTEADTEGSYFYVKTSDTPEGEVADSVHSPVIGQTFPYANLQVENIVVTDGVLTIGVVGGPTSHTFFNDVQVLIAGAVAGFDYAGAYKEVEDGVETLENAAQVVGVELYDLNGRRISVATQGIVIVKKYMSDGSINVQKVIKK